jgi:pullulanase
VKDWETALRSARPDVLLYGEPWTGGGPVRFGKGEQRGMRVGVFNDDFRNTIRGELDGPGPGFATGGGGSHDSLKRAVTGSLNEKPGDGGFTSSPEESINYVSAHDNLTLWDKIKITMPNASRDEQAHAVNLANATVLLSQGVPFLEGGVEIGRDKGGDRDTYNRDDTINGYHWEHAPLSHENYAYLRGLIALRRELSAFRLPDAAGIHKQMRVWDAGRLPDKTIAYELDGGPRDEWKHILVVLHGARESASIDLPDGEWTVLVDGEHAGTTPLRTVHGSLTLTPLAAFVLVK